MTRSSGKPDSSPVRGRSLSDLVTDTGATAGVQPFSSDVWVKIAVVAGLFLWAYYRQLHHLVQMWLDDADWSHGFLIPLFSLYLLYAHREEIFRAERKPSLIGLVVLLLGIAGTVAGLKVTPWVAKLSMLIVLAGLVLFLHGWRMLRLTIVPILFLGLAIPIPGPLYERIALPLQGLAASSSGAILRLFGVDIQVDALHMTVKEMSEPHKVHPLTVAEACSGVRSLMAFVALSTAMAFVEKRPAWQRIILILSGIPIAVACNILRVALTSTMFVWGMPDLGQGIMHEFMGMALLVPAFFLLLLLNKLLWAVYVVDEEEQDASEDAGGASADEVQATQPGDAS